MGMDLFATLNTAMLGMYTQQAAISVVSNNVANANTPGYTRESPVIVSTPPISMNTLTQTGEPVSFGTGSEVTGIERIRNSFLDLQYRQSNASMNFWNEVNTQFQYIQQLFNMPASSGSEGLSDYYNNFWSAAQQLATNPSNVANQEGLVQSAQALIGNVQSIYSTLQQTQSNYTSQIQTNVASINSILEQISNLNVEINESSNGGTAPNALLDKRDLLLDNLSNLTDYTVTNMSGNQIGINIGGTNVLSGQTYTPLTVQAVNGKPNASFVNADNSPVTFSQGQMGAVFNLRDKIIPQYETQLNSFALDLASKVNTVLEQSYDQNGNLGQPLFNITTTAGQPTSLYSITGSYPPSGTALDPTQPIDKINKLTNLTPFTLNINGATINVNPSVDTLNSIVSKINDTNVGVSASLSPRGNLTLSATGSMNFDLMRTTSEGTTNPINISDYNAGFLSDLGFSTTDGTVNLNDYLPMGSDYDYSLNVSSKDPLMNISVNQQLVSNPSLLASDFSPVFSNGSAVGTVGPTGPQGSGGIQQIVALDNSNDPQSFGAYFSTLVSDLGIQGQNANSMYTNETSLVNQISQDRQEVSSVSINDELSNMILYQNAYTASARVITAVNSMLQTLINMVQ